MLVSCVKVLPSLLDMSNDVFGCELTYSFFTYDLNFSNVDGYEPGFYDMFD